MLTFSTNPEVAEQQMNAIIFYLTAFGYIDGNFDFTEKTFVRIYIRQLVSERAKLAMPDADQKTRDEVEKFVYAKLKLRSYEIFQSFDRDNQHELLATIDELIYADGSVHPSEKKFRAEIEALLDKPVPLGDADIEVIPSKEIAIDDPAAVRPRLDDHPFF